MAGQFCFWGDVGWGIDAGLGEDARGGLVGGVGGVLFVVDGDAGEQGAVEDASFEPSQVFCRYVAGSGSRVRASLCMSRVRLCGRAR